MLLYNKNYCTTVCILSKFKFIFLSVTVTACEMLTLNAVIIKNHKHCKCIKIVATCYWLYSTEQNCLLCLVLSRTRLPNST